MQVWHGASSFAPEVDMVRHIRFHGRGGEEVRLASRIVSRAVFLNGLAVQDSPLYGAERRGAPVVAFTRFSEWPIYERGYVERPDVGVVIDSLLLAQPDAAALGGLDEGSLLLVNSTQSSEELGNRYQTPARVVIMDVTSIALDILRYQLLSAPIAGFTLKAAALTPWNRVAEAVETELAGIGLSREVIACNLRATETVYHAAPSVGLSAPRQPWATVPRRPFVVPRLPARIAVPAIEAEATPALRTTEGWRLYRPVVQRARCTRCFLCFALCPEGAIQLDSQDYPVVDYSHCKGCLACMTECAPGAIDERREDAA
jgi:pyruvate ferredoxin oxidoreductase gamma subunit